MYAVPDKINQADYALDAAVTLLEFYEDYFSIPYPLPKQGRDLHRYYTLWHLLNPAIDYIPLISSLWLTHQSLKSLKPWQVSTIGLILLTLDLFSKLVRVKAGLDTVPEVHGMEIILPWDFKEKPNIVGRQQNANATLFPLLAHTCIRC